MCSNLDSALSSNSFLAEEKEEEEERGGRGTKVEEEVEVEGVEVEEVEEEGAGEALGFFANTSLAPCLLKLVLGSVSVFGCLSSSLSLIFGFLVGTEFVVSVFGFFVGLCSVVSFNFSFLDGKESVSSVIFRFLVESVIVEGIGVLLLGEILGLEDNIRLLKV